MIDGMDLSDALILGILQGITEFLPVSSSGHLVLGENLLGLNVATLKSFDVMVHLGTLFAILLYFKKDVCGLLRGLWRLFSGGWRPFSGVASSKSDDYTKLILYIVIAMIPAVVVGLLWGDAIDAAFRSPKMVGMWMLIVGVVFFLGERVRRFRSRSEIGRLSALIIGLAQAVALIPGVSRSGSTIVAGLFQGVERSQAARFSFLLGIPAILGAGVLTATQGFEVDFGPMVVGLLSSFVFGFFSISFLMKFLKKHSLNIFAVYLILVGSVFFFKIL